MQNPAMTAKTPAQRQAERRERMRTAGYTEILLRVHPEDKERVMKYAARLAAARERVGKTEQKS